MKKIIISNGFRQATYPSTFHDSNVYYIEGFAYAFCPSLWEIDFKPLEGELKEYVRVNYDLDKNEFVQLYRTEEHQKIRIPFNGSHVQQFEEPWRVSNEDVVGGCSDVY